MTDALPGNPFTERRTQPDLATVMLAVQNQQSTIQHMLRELLELKSDFHAHTKEETHQIESAVVAAVKQLVSDAFINSDLAQHKLDHKAVEDQIQLKKRIDEENAAAIRRGAREVLIFVLKCILIAAATGTGLYTVIGNQAKSVIDLPRAVVEAPQK